MVTGDGRVDLLAPGVDAAPESPGLSESVAGKIGGGIHGTGALMIDEDGGGGTVPSAEDFLHEVLAEEYGTLDAGGLEFLTSADVDDACGGVAHGVDELGRGDLHAAVFLFTGMEVIDDLGDGEVLVAGADLGDGFVRAEAAGGAAANVVFAEEGTLSAGGDFQQLAHCGIAGYSGGCLHEGKIRGVEGAGKGENSKSEKESGLPIRRLGGAEKFVKETLYGVPAQRVWCWALMRAQTLREARWIFAVLIAITILLGWLVPAAALGGIALILYTFYFFRDPDRVAPTDGEAVVAPADGVVVEIVEKEETEVANATMRRVAIFLSVFDVHTNRAPIYAEVTYRKHYPGKFLDARNPEASMANESQTWGFRTGTTTLVVRQISGAIARRIVGWSKVGDRVAKGERFGMIRFGSRTEVYVPLECEITVKPGDRVKAGETIVARLRKEPS